MYLLQYSTCAWRTLTTDSSVCSYRQSDASVRIQVVSFLFELLSFAQQNGHPWLQEEYLLSLLCSLLEKVSCEALTSALHCLSGGSH